MSPCGVSSLAGSPCYLGWSSNFNRWLFCLLGFYNLLGDAKNDSPHGSPAPPLVKCTLGVGGGCLVESTGCLIKCPFCTLVRVRVRACCNGN
jgi:hypothetical protein